MTKSRMHTTCRRWALLLAVVLGGGLVGAQQEAAAPPASAAPPESAAAPIQPASAAPAVPAAPPALSALPAAPPAGVATASPSPAGLRAAVSGASPMSGAGALRGPLRLKFINAPTDMLLDAYAEQTGRTLLIAPEVPKASVTLRSQGDLLTQEEYLDAIETVLGMNKIALIREGDKFLRVVPNSTARTEPMPFRGLEPTAEGKEGEKPPKDSGELISQMIQLRNLQPADAQKAIEPLKHAYGQIHVFENVNSILVTDTAATVNRIAQMLGFIDKPPETREVPLIYDIRFAKATEIKAKLEEIIAESQKEGKKSTIPQQRQTGAPGVVTTPVVPGVPGVIRAIRPPASPESAAAAMEAVERGIISGTVKIVADDRTGKLIIISWPENKVFFDMVIKVFDVETAPDVMVRVFRLEFAKAKDIAAMLNELIGAAVRPEAARGAGAGPATPGAPGGATESVALKAYVERQQQAAAAAAAGTGAEGAKTKIGQLAKENVKILSDERTNSLIIMASRGDLATIAEIVSGMDLMLFQVLIESLVVSVDLRGTLDTGVTWFQQAMTAYENQASGGRKPRFNFAGGGGGGGATPTPIDATAAGFTGGGLTYYFSYFDIPLDVVLKAISTDSRTHIISSPIIQTTDNKEAKIDVSTEQYFYKGQTPTSVGGLISYVPNVETRKVGINLTVTPHINTNRFVLMDIVQKIENQAGTQDIAGQGTWPVIATREMSASIGVGSGGTIVLGGLSSRDMTTSRTKIPLLGDVPLLGRLFNSTADSKQRQEILVFITPYVLDSPEELAQESKRMRNAMGKEGRWQRGWSGSPLGDPTRQEEREAREREKEARQAAEAAERSAQAKKAADAKLFKEMRNTEQQWSEALGNVDREIEKDITK